MRPHGPVGQVRQRTPDTITALNGEAAQTKAGRGVRWPNPIRSDPAATTRRSHVPSPEALFPNDGDDRGIRELANTPGHAERFGACRDDGPGFVNRVTSVAQKTHQRGPVPCLGNGPP